jgi:hypothetical protein
MSSDERTYEVGYGKPPVATRFQPGNPGGKGRAKGSKNLKTDLIEELQEKISLTKGDRKVRISKQRVLIKALVVKGIKGDRSSIDTALNLLLRVTGADAQEDIAALSDVDQAILDDFLSRGGERNG